jgi:hypothetical protein
MVHRGGRWSPYQAVLSLTSWAATHWHILDGLAMEQWGPTVDLLDIPLHRLINWLHVKALSMVEWDEDGKHMAELTAVLEWPDVAEADDLEAQSRQAHDALKSLGIVLPAFDGSPWAQAEAVS